MRFIVISLAIVCYCLGALSVSTEAQSQFVRIKFEVDGKEQPDRKYKILINADGHRVEARLIDKSFVVPPEVRNCKKIEVQFVSGEYKLVFTPLTKEHFDSEWVIGVKNPPFEERPDLPLVKAGKMLRLIYYIEFHPKRAEGTGWVIPVYK